MFQENSIETCILSRVKQITSPGWMHETSARTWCSGRTWREQVGREVGGGIGMGKTCEPKAFSFQCMTKFTTKKKNKQTNKQKNKNKTNKKKLLGFPKQGWALFFIFLPIFQLPLSSFPTPSPIAITSHMLCSLSQTYLSLTSSGLFPFFLLRAHQVLPPLGSLPWSLYVPS